MAPLLKRWTSREGNPAPSRASGPSTPRDGHWRGTGLTKGKWEPGLCSFPRVRKGTCSLVETSSLQHPGCWSVLLNSSLPHVSGGGCHAVEGFGNMTKATLLELGGGRPGLSA